MRKSVEFEKLVAVIAAELEPTAVVTWDDHIIGKLSGRKRQIDVSIRRQEPDFLGIIDAKDYRRPATIDRIDALSSVMREVEAHYGALVCSGGFSGSIHQYARNCGISLFNVHDAQSTDWSLELKIPIVWTEVTPLVQVVGEFAFDGGDQINKTPQGLPVTGDGGLTVIAPLATFERLWNEGALPQEPGVTHRMVTHEPVQVVVHDAENNRRLRPVYNYGFVYTVQARTWLGKFQPSECRGLVDYLDERAFLASYLPEIAIPIQRDEQWEPVDDPSQLAITARGTAVICTAPMLVTDATLEEFEVTYLGPLPPEPSDSGAEA
jgi:hypothetical protein